MILSVGECAGKTIQSKIPDLNIIHENPEFYNAVFAKVKYMLVDLRNLSSIFHNAFFGYKAVRLLCGSGLEMHCVCYSGIRRQDSR